LGPSLPGGRANASLSLIEMEKRVLVVPLERAGERLDLFLAQSIPELSRSRIQRLIKEGRVTINGIKALKPRQKLAGKEEIELEIPPPEKILLEPEPGVPFEILYEDRDIVVLNKPPGLVVHPAAGHSKGTLVQGLLARVRDLSGIGGELRPGIVHRLDKDTSGLLLVAKHDQAHQALSLQFKEREVSKVYLALVHGVPSLSSGHVDRPLGRHPVHRKKMSIQPHGREAYTAWKVREGFKRMRAALLEVYPRTGRTHQIRVHLASIGHPIVGDRLYGGLRPTGPKALRQMLHAWKLSFFHPHTGKRLSFEAPLPPDFQSLLEELRAQERYGKKGPL